MNIKIYISNSTNKKDLLVKESLTKHLKILQMGKSFTINNKCDINGGENRQDAINNFIQKADIIIPLISIDYLNECEEEMDIIHNSTAYSDSFAPPFRFGLTP